MIAAIERLLIFDEVCQFKYEVQSGSFFKIGVIWYCSSLYNRAFCLIELDHINVRGEIKESRLLGLPEEGLL